MGRKDLGGKILLDLNDVFADIVNVLMFKNKDVLKPEELVSDRLESQFYADGEYHEQRRDVAKFWEKCGIRIAFFGIENERRSTREMPLRIMSYDGGVYRSQINTEDGRDKGERDSGLGGVEDKVKGKNRSKREKNKECKRREYYPVISLVLNFNTEHRWSSPKSLKEIVNIPRELEPFVNDYRIHVVDVAFLDREIIDSFKSEFWFVADYFWQIRNRKDYKPSEKRIKHAHEVLQMMSAMTGDNSFEKVYNEEDKKQGGNRKMSEYIERIVAEGGRKIKRQERENGIKVLVESLSEVGASDSVIVRKIIEKYKCSEKAAVNYLGKYKKIPA